jgi:uncharacterized protein
MAQNRDEIETRNKAVVRAGFDAWSSRTGSPYDLLAGDATWTIVGHSAASKTCPSKEAFMSDVIRPFNARMKVGLKPTIRNLYAEGDTVIVFFDANGTARDGKPYANTYAWFLDMRDGKIVKAFASFDSVVFKSSGSASNRSREVSCGDSTTENLTLDKDCRIGVSCRSGPPRLSRFVKLASAVRARDR